MKGEINGKVTSKNGFYVGDPCYVLAKENYDGVFGAAGYADGKYTGKTKDGKEFDFILGGTAYGDGCYSDQYGHNYGVDAGIIGVVPIELCERYGRAMTIDELNKLGHYFAGTEADFEDIDGQFRIYIAGGDGGQHVDIDTDDEYGYYDCGDYEDDDYPDDYYDDYDEYPEEEDDF